MWYPATVTSAGASPITLDEAKRQLRVTGASDDALIQGLLDAAMAQAEAYCGIRIGPAEVTVACDDFADLARIPVAPLREITSISYVDVAGVTQEVEADVYEEHLAGLSPSVSLSFGERWPPYRAGSRITLVAEAGYETVPANIRAAVLLMLTRLYPLAKSDVLVRSETVEGVGATQWGGAVEVTGAIAEVSHGLLEPYRNWAMR